MPFQLIAWVTASILLIWPLQACLADIDAGDQEQNQNKVDLPTVLDNDFLDDLPFAQRRQILREELVTDGQNNPSPSLPKKYNLLIR